ncbi:hypothetical protein M758_1G012600 [Ceratodon purpureus]|nr:hypothetical protein M758_1G012600 [Ceratodon purpureus]
MHEVNTLNLQYNEKVNSASDVETEIAAEVSTLKHIQERKRELSRALLRLDDENRASESHLQVTVAI